MNENSGGSVRILMVEDDREALDQVQELLRGLPGGDRYQVEWASSYDAGRVALSRQAHDVCLLDYRLGGEDGVGLLELAVRSGWEVPIVFVTGTVDVSIERRALAAGAVDYLVKRDLDARQLERTVWQSLQRGRMVQDLRSSERRMRAVFDSALDAMLVVDGEPASVDFNPSALALFGLSRGELCKKKLMDLLPSLLNETGVPPWSALLEDGQAEGEARVVRPDGTERLVEYRATAEIEPGRHLIILRDVTDRRKAEQRQLRLAAMVESAADAVETLTVDGIIEYWSPAAERTYGYAASEVVGRAKATLVPADRVEELEDWLRRVGSGESIQNVETLRRRKDGTTFAASITFSPVREGSKVVAISLITRDVSEKKKLEQQLAASDRMASLGTLAAGVAHEINNPLASLIANLSFMSEELSGSQASAAAPVLREALEDASASADRLREVVRDLKLFSRRDEEQSGPVDLHRVIDSTLRVAWNEIRHRARVVKDYGSIAAVFGNEGRLGQVLLNLIVNAAQAIKEGAADRNEIRLTTRMGDADTVVVEVQDTGPGMEPEVLSRLFEPFFTTKPAGIGTGLGLSICRRIIQEFHGTIAVESNVGRGTTFRVTLPARAAAAHAAPAQAPAPAPAKSLVPAHPSVAGHVLVVDDEPLIAKAVRRALGASHKVTTAASGAAALEQLLAGATFDVILCDMMMPLMTGMELYEELRRTKPQQAERMVFLTGGAFTAEASAFLEQRPERRIEKPFDVHKLRALVNARVSASPECAKAPGI